jgi:two-component system, NarL family, response regulator NreC
MEMETKILIVEDQALIRKGISALVKSNYPTWEIHEAANGIQAVTKANKVRPDLILMDYRMPGMDGLRAAEIITTNLPDAKIIMVSAEENSEFMFDALDAHVAGIVAKTASDEELLHAINQVKNGQSYLNNMVSDKVLQHFYEKKKKKIKSKHLQTSLLTDRELEILNLLAKGNSAALIATKLFISKRTVEAHKANIMKKCQVGSTPDLIRFAISKKLITI